MKNKTIRQEFKNAIRCGRGAAHLIMKANPEVDFSNAIIKAALKNYAYDGQCEGSRAEYVYELILLSRKQNKIKKAILEGVAKEDDDTWSLVQLFDLAKIYAQAGDKQAKKAIYQRFYKKIIFGSSWCGAYQIIDLDGIEGLLQVSKIIGKAIVAHPDKWEDEILINYCQEQNPSINVWKELEGNTNKFIRAYINNVRATEKERANYIKEKKEKVLYNDIVEEIEQWSGRWWPRHFCMRSTDNELVMIAKSFLSEKNLSKKEKLLSVFRFRSFPFDHCPILKIAKGKQKGKSTLKEYAIDALKNIRHNDVRLFALKKIRTSNTPYKYTDIFAGNYMAGDAAMLNEIAVKYNNEHIIESLANSYINIFTANKTKECLEPLTTLYLKMTCGQCRKNIIEILIDTKTLPQQIKSEIQFDSNQEIRALFVVPDSSL